MLDGQHYLGLLDAYGTVVVLTLLARFLMTRSETRRPIWPAQAPVTLPRPWLDLGLFFVAIVGVIGVGQLYQRGLLLPTGGPLGFVLEAINQAVIFLPIPLLVLVRGQSSKTVLLPGGRVGLRLAAGLALGVVAALVFVVVTPTSLREYGLAYVSEARRGRLAAHVVQVFLEDLAIAGLLVRLAAAIRSEWAAGIAVACLFAAAHVPAMLGADTPVEWIDWMHRGLDAVIGIIVMVGLLKTRDLLWLFPMHFALDMTQFA